MTNVAAVSAVNTVCSKAVACINFADVVVSECCRSSLLRLIKPLYPSNIYPVLSGGLGNRTLVH